MRNGKLEVLSNAFGEKTTASVVAFHEDGSIAVGNAARANIVHDPAHTVSSAKRLIGRYYFSEEVRKAQAICAYEITEATGHGVRISIREEEFSLPEISAMVLREMKQVAEARLNEEITKAVITVPAYFNDNQRQATKDAGQIAGLEVLRILNEPTAAALAYGFGKGLEQTVAIYDLGGGTFDVSILEIGQDIFEVLATCGDTFLGGDDFDDRILDLLADGFVAKEGINPRNDPFAFEKLKVAAEAAKKSLSVEDEVEIRIPDVLVGEDGETRSLEYTITREEFGALIQDLVQRTFKVCDEAMQQAGLTVRDLDGIILVGGPTRLPIIREAVKNYFQQEPRSDVDPDEVVSMGAAIHAASLINSDTDSVLLDVTPLDLRIGVAGGLAEPVIERNTPVPIEQSRSFSPFQDHQKSVKLKVYQGDSRQADENELLGQFEFSGFTPGLRSETSIDVSFEINADGIVNVTARDPESGQEASTEITLSSGLSDQDMGDILSRDRTADVLQTEVGSEIGPNDLATPTIGTEVLECDELELVTDDEIHDLEELTELEDLDALSEDELAAIASEVDDDDDPNAISMGDVSDLIAEAVPLDDLPEAENPNPAIGKVNLKTVAVAPELPTAPGANESPETDAVELTKDDLFDLNSGEDLTDLLEEE
ncbi:MAG: Hsp70 family protein [Deltaproteobacteria bacterium]|nr:Hsp70 family protein [Deltaproteobacteria bacterium]MBW2388726.1 Hsp70 family protein [Deltaproteobacteria bacterium]